MFCNDVCSVMGVLVHVCNTGQWRLFIDLSKMSLKVVLLHNGNRFPSVPLARAANITLGFFSQKILPKSVTNAVKDFTKTLWAWKSGTKAGGLQICWQIIAGY